MKKCMQVERELIALCQQGDRRAQYKLYEHCYSPLMSVCARYTQNKDDALANLNLGFLKVLDKLHLYDGKKPFVAWIKRLMINTVIDEYRKNRKKEEAFVPVDLNEAPELGPGVYSEVEKYVSDDELNSYVQQLPPMSRKVFNLYAIDGFQHKEIAEMLNISTGTSKWHLSFARKSLKACLARERETVKVG